jgi:hypothetical protein
VKYLSTFSLLVAVVLSFEESGDRTRQRHYAAWVAINSAQGKGGSGGCIGARSRSRIEIVYLSSGSTAP